MTVFDAAEARRNKYTLCYVLSIKLPVSTIHTRHSSRSEVVKSGVLGPERASDSVAGGLNEGSIYHPRGIRGLEDLVSFTYQSNRVKFFCNDKEM